VKPISEWTDDELQSLIDHPGRSTWPRDFPDEVLRLRAMQSRHNGEMEAYCRYQREAAARAEKAEAELAAARAEAEELAWQASCAVEAEAALARVQAVMYANPESRSGSALASDIRAAIEGEQ
jgi:hypothetical protein